MIAGQETGQGFNEQFARLARAFAHPKRVELLDLLDQGERPVDSLAATTGLAVTTASSHLAVLRNAHLVTTRREGTRVHYRLANDEVSAVLDSLRHLASSILPEVTIANSSLDDGSEPVSRDDLLRRARRGEVVVLDVRPAHEYRAGHIKDAISVPLDELEGRLGELPAGAEIVAYCRGPYCVLAPEAVRLLRRRGHHARRLSEGFPEWRRAGLPVEEGR